MSILKFQPKARENARISNLSITDRTSKTAEVLLYGPILGEREVKYFGEGISSKMFDDILKEIGNASKIKIRINSEGGSVTEARAIYNMLMKNPATINIEIEGIAASAATFLAMAGDSIAIGETDLFMIHNANVIVMDYMAGDELIKLGNDLKKVDSIIIDMYAKRTGISKSKIEKWMDEETYFTGKEAYKYGFADQLFEDRQQVSACLIDHTRFHNAPTSLASNPGLSRTTAFLEALNERMKTYD